MQKKRDSFLSKTAQASKAQHLAKTPVQYIRSRCSSCSHLQPQHRLPQLWGCSRSPDFAGSQVYTAAPSHLCNTYIHLQLPTAMVPFPNCRGPYQGVPSLYPMPPAPVRTRRCYPTPGRLEGATWLQKMATLATLRRDEADGWAETDRRTPRAAE